MKQADFLKKLFDSYRRGDAEEFHAAAEGLIQIERKNKHSALANELEQLLHQQSSTGEASGDLQSPPVSSPVQSKQRGLFKERQPRKRLADVVLGPVASGLMDRLIRDFQNSEVLKAQGVRPHHHILFCGPSGCGKTVTAEAIAGELQVPLLDVSLNSVLSSQLGETAANLEAVFDYARTKRFVVLFDEFDAIGRSRDDIGERGEIKRVLNSFVQELDRFEGDSLVIAATNFEQGLDRALWRRFPSVIRFERPREAQIEELVRRNLAPLKVQQQQVEDLVRNLAGSTAAEVEIACVDVRKSCILRHQDIIDAQDLREALARRVYRQSILQKVARAATATVDLD
jgi:SpoVK/Ycf46/Vps4 family AAA+-type ATPase